MPLHRADDGIRTRDPHLGKVMRYQLRYIRMLRAGSPSVAKVDNSAPEQSRTNPCEFGLGKRIQPAQRRMLVFVLGAAGTS